MFFFGITPAQGQLINLPKGLNIPSNIQMTQQGNLDVGKVELDGQTLFSIAVPSTEGGATDQNQISPLERRVKTINFHLASIIKDDFDPDSLSINPSILNNQTVLVASDKNWGPRYLLTVTPFDLELDEPDTIEKIAQKWAEIIKNALLQSREQRQFPYYKQQIPFVLGMMLAMIAGSIILGIIYRWRNTLRQKLAERKEELNSLDALTLELTEEPPTPIETRSPDVPRSSFRRLSQYLPHLTVDQYITLNVILRPVILAAQISLWLSGMAIIFLRFPQTREFGYWLLRVPLAYVGIPVLMFVAKSLLDGFVHFYLNRIIDMSEEKGKENTRINPRAVTIFHVLQEFNTYLILAIGFLLFFYVINALYFALIILAAIAFLSQNVLQDFVKTYFLLAEDQYALGDWIQIGEISGKVEKVSLRNSQIRSRCGDLFTISHISFNQVLNYTHGRSGINLWIDVAYNTDLEQAIAVIEKVSQSLQQDSYWENYILRSDMKGVEKFGDNSITLGLVLETKIGEQWGVAREFRRRLKPALDQAGITIPFPQRSIWFENALITTNQTSSS
ncbi:MAG: mechanosensitive ion channel family protein [Snowella sp.]|nr:mechanosensitive ion channel family protein [Snowella sp.]